MATLTSVIAVEVRGAPPERWTPRHRRQAEVDIRPHYTRHGIVTLKIGTNKVALRSDELIRAIEGAMKAQLFLFPGIDEGEFDKQEGQDMPSTRPAPYVGDPLPFPEVEDKPTVETVIEAIKENPTVNTDQVL